MKFNLLILGGLLALSGCGTPPKLVVMSPDVETKMLQIIAVEFDSNFRLQGGSLEPQVPPSFKAAEITGPYQGFHEFKLVTMYCIRASIPGVFFGSGAAGLIVLTPNTNGDPGGFNVKLIQPRRNGRLDGCRDTYYRPFPELIAVRENRRKNFDLEAELKAFHSRPRDTSRPDKL